MIGAFGLGVPMPGVFKGGYLRFALGSALVLEKNVVIAVGIERRVQIDQVNATRRDVFPQDVQIVAVVESVHRKC